jgi:hypothetical protein
MEKASGRAACRHVFWTEESVVDEEIDLIFYQFLIYLKHLSR